MIFFTVMAHEIGPAIGLGHAAVPEPVSLLLFGAGLAGLAGFKKRKKS